MTQIKTLVDKYGIINTAMKVLLDELKINFLEALAELEDSQCHQKRSFPKTRLHVVKGINRFLA